MRPHPRIRKTVKWGGAAATVLLVVVWIASGRWHAVIGNASGLTIRLSSGQISMGLSEAPLHADWLDGYSYLSYSPTYRWSFSTSAEYYEHGMATVPIWFLLLFTAGVPMLLWRQELKRRRAQLNLCPKCNYDRTGLAPDARCPECGRATTRSA